MINLMDLWDKLRGRKTQAECQAQRLLEEAAPQAPLIARKELPVPSKLSEDKELRAGEVINLIRGRFGSRISRRIVKQIREYYNVDLRRKGAFKADPRHKKMLFIQPVRA